MVDALAKARKLLKPAAKADLAELAGPEQWREALRGEGCLEVFERREAVGFMLAPDCAAALGERIDALEAALERRASAEAFRPGEGRADEAREVSALPSAPPWDELKDRYERLRCEFGANPELVSMPAGERGDWAPWSS